MREKNGRASIYQPKLGVGLELSFDTEELDGFVEWKMMGVRDYVLGLECGNCYPGGRDVMRRTDGIWAKPIIDILVEVPLRTDLQTIKELLVDHGYICMNCQEKRVSFNKGYTEQGFAEKVFHLHLRYDGDHDEILFRDYLNAHSEIAKEYEELKMGLWKAFEHDRDGYTEAKAEFVMRCMRDARAETERTEHTAEKMLKVIIFDFDYTLGDSTNGIVFCVNYALESLGHPSSDVDSIKRTIGLSLKETYFALTAEKDWDKAEQFSRLFKIQADRVMVENTQLYADVKKILKKLKEKGYKLAIVTTKFHYRIEQILKKFDAVNLIDLIVGAEDVKAEKPAPEGLLWAIERLNAEKSEVLYVGDSLVDAKTAENAAVKFAAVLTGTTVREEFEKYNHVYIGENVSAVYKYIMDDMGYSSASR